MFYSYSYNQHTIQYQFRLYLIEYHRQIHTNTGTIFNVLHFSQKHFMIDVFLSIHYLMCLCKNKKYTCLINKFKKKNHYLNY
jgi:hypothetical protein